MLDFMQFLNPGAEFRSAPFWSLNDELEKDELIRQIREMHKQGMGGFFMHPRGGMKTEYMSQDYLKVINRCIEEADALGMKAWLYDEDRFPSGSAAGRVVKERPDFGIKVLSLIETPEGRSFEVMGMSGQESLDNNSYTDLCCKDAVDAFIQKTHSKYAEEFCSYFSGTVPGIFTDEPYFYINKQGRRLLPWSRDFEREFLKRKGYGIQDHLSSLFYQEGEYKKVRFDYWDVLLGLFVDSFTQNIYEWCERKGLKFTGHFWEHVFPYPTHNGSVMPNYEFMHYPGIDMLFNTEEKRDQVGNDLIIKEVSSVGNQLSKERVLSESYGASGWELNFSDQKRIVDWQFALGINFVCQHLLHYSLKGYRKRDFPLSFLDQPWWQHYKLLGDYIGRLGYILSQGDFAADILVLHPSSSTWAEYQEGGNNDEVEKIGQSAQWLCETLSQLHYFYELGDDILMEKYGKVGKGRLHIGKMSYSTVLMPRMTLLRSSSFQLLQQFAEQGGKIITMDSTPTLLDGLENMAVVSFFKSPQVTKLSADKKVLEKGLTSLGNQQADLVNLKQGDLSELYVHKRIQDKKEIWFFCNVSKTEKMEVLFKLPEAGVTEEWDAVTGKRWVREIIKYKDYNAVSLEFYPIQSHLLIIDCSLKGTVQSVPDKVNKTMSELDLSSWKVRRLNYNSYTLKLCQYRMEEQTWSEPVDVLKVDDLLGEKLGFGHRGIFSRQPWMYTEAERAIRAQVQVRFTFNIGSMPEGELFVAAESPEDFDVLVNGIKAEPMEKVHFNRAFIMYDICRHVRNGDNEVILAAKNYGINSGIESIYLIGDFKLTRTQDGLLVEKENIISVGDWTLFGYPYYSGAMEYTAHFSMDEKPVGQVLLRLGKLWMVAAQVIVNDHQVSILGWEPYEVDIGAFVKEGANTISVIVMNSLQNLLGSHNGVETPGFSSPGSFNYEQGDIRFVSSGFDGKGTIQWQL